MNEIVLNIFPVFLVVSAVAAVVFEDLMSSAIALSVFSTVLTGLFILLKAPDVAMAEVVISTGLVTAMFVVTINKVRENGK